MIPQHSTQTFPFTNGDFEAISNLAFDEFGLHLRENKKSLVYSRLVGRIRQLNLLDFSQYCTLLKSSGGENERLNMLSSLTTNVTRFFREEHHFELLKEAVFPRAMERARTGEVVRLWSAGCSTGQEPYSIAMALMQYAPDAKNYDIKILASDVDVNVLNFASAGEYSEEDTTSVPSDLLAKYFDRIECGDHRVNPALKDIISFRKLNLMKPWPMKHQFDLIFCRNVAIYFDEQTRERLWHRFCTALRPKSFLCIGHSERVAGAASESLTSLGHTSYQRANFEIPNRSEPKS